jgi:transcriptional regulator GlxA family with amidase domain
MLHARVLLYDGFDELDAIAPYEVLANALKPGGGDVAYVTLEGAREVAGSHGTVVRADAALDEQATLLVVPGGGWNDRSPQGARAEAERGDVPRAIAAAHARGVTIASVCTGGMLLAAAGLLGGRPAVTHHGALEDLAAAGAQVVQARVVDDGDILSAGGVTSGIDLALHIVERELGAGIAEQVAREMEHDRRGPLHRGPGAATSAAGM